MTHVRKLPVALLIMTAMAILVSCQDNEPSEKITDPRGKNYSVENPATISDTKAMLLAAGQSDFAYDIAHGIIADEENNVISPLSLYMFSAMLANGADGTTADQILGALHAENRNEVIAMCRRQIDSFNEIRENRIFTAEYTREELLAMGMDPELVDEIIAGFSKKEKLNPDAIIANAIWMDKKLAIPYKTYTEECEKWLDADVNNIDFASTEAPSIINQWVNEKTNGMIPALFKSGYPITGKIVCTNALYINAPWVNHFSSTSERLTFNNKDNSESKTNGFTTTDYIDYSENQEAECVSINLGGRENPIFTYTVFLPKNKSTDPSRLLNKATTEALTKQTGQRYISLFMPEHEISSSIDPDFIQMAMESMGMTDIFSKGANFNRMGDFEHSIFQIVHKATIRVTEDGVTAAAATGNEWASDSGKPKPEPYVLKVDHPFAFQITDCKTGMILFCGTVNNL